MASYAGNTLPLGLLSNAGFNPLAASPLVVPVGLAGLEPLAASPLVAPSAGTVPPARLAEPVAARCLMAAEPLGAFPLAASSAGSALPAGLAEPIDGILQ